MLHDHDRVSVGEHQSNNVVKVFAGVEFSKVFCIFAVVRMKNTIRASEQLWPE